MALTVENLQNYVSDCLLTDDPPVPQGATKFSYSARISNCRTLICDTGLDFLDVRVSFSEMRLNNIWYQIIIVDFNKNNNYEKNVPIIVILYRLAGWKATVLLKQTIEWCLDFMQ